MEIVRADNICVKFGEVTVLDKLSLQYEQGHIYGLVGENGAGKTTLFNCLMGFLKYNGTVEFKHNITIGFMPAESFFYPFITGREYIDFCLKAKKRSVDESRIACINEYFELPLSRYASRYSTGMRKKLDFMSLLLQNNDLMILDEPFNGVDLKGVINMRRLIREARDKGTTVIISSHQIPSLREICDEIDFLCNHKILKRYTNESVDEIEQDVLKKI